MSARHALSLQPRTAEHCSTQAETADTSHTHAHGKAASQPVSHALLRRGRPPVLLSQTCSLLPRRRCCRRQTPQQGRHTPPGGTQLGFVCWSGRQEAVHAAAFDRHQKCECLRPRALQLLICKAHHPYASICIRRHLPQLSPQRCQVAVACKLSRVHAQAAALSCACSHLVLQIPVLPETPLQRLHNARWCVTC